MNLNAKTILNHKVVAVVNLFWAIFHIWIAITIEQDYFFLGYCYRIRADIHWRLQG